MKKWIAIIPVIMIFNWLIISVFNKTLFIKFEKVPTSGLKEIVDKALAGTEGTYSIAIKNFKTGESYYLNEYKVFQSGSLYKMWILVTVFNQMERGKLSEDEVLSGDVVELNKEFDISPDDAEMTEGRITLTVKDALRQMIIISHNYAALLLASRVQISTISDFLKENGFNESSLIETPRTTSFDVAYFLEKLYRRELATPEDTQRMLDILKGQTLNDKLPKYFPEGVSIAHKTGEIGWFSHDAGIVFSGKGDYAIVIMSESNFPPGANERIAEISREVFNYFQEK